jgi:diacylglycerol kinase (ATP)
METPMSSTRILAILNPAANRGKIAAHRAAVKRGLEGVDAEYVETRQRGDAGKFARVAAEQGRPIVIVGGDGSINEVASGILSVGVPVPLGIVPAGSGNDFAWNTLHLPRDLAAAVAVALHGTPTPVDAGTVNGRYFVNSFSVGLDGDIAAAAERMKRYPFMHGSLLYYATTLRQLFFGYGRCPWLAIQFDGEPAAPEQRRYVLAAVMNGPTYGAGFHIVPHADNADGSFEICTIRHTPLLRALRLLPVVKKGEHTHEPEVAFFKARSVHIESRKLVNAQMDGETMQATHYDAQILPGALRVRVGTTG